MTYAKGLFGILTSIFCLFVIIGKAYPLDRQEVIAVLRNITSAHFRSEYVFDPKIEQEKTSMIFGRTGVIKLPDSYQYKFSISPLPLDKERRKAFKDNLDLAGVILGLQGAEVIGVNKRVFQKTDLDALISARIVEVEDYDSSTLEKMRLETLGWSEGLPDREGKMLFPEELNYLMDLGDLASKAQEISHGLFEGTLDPQAYLAVQNKRVQHLEQEWNSSSAKSVNWKEQLNSLPDNHKKLLTQHRISIFFNSTEELDMVLIELYENLDPSLIKKITFDKFNQAVAIDVPMLQETGTLKHQESKASDYLRRSSAIFIAESLQALYAGRNSFPVEEAGVALGSFENPIVKRILEKLIVNRMSDTKEKHDEVELFWKKMITGTLVDEAPFNQGPLIYKSLDSGDGFILSYLQEVKHDPIEYRANEHVSCLANGCRVEYRVSGKYVRDKIRRNSLEDIVSGLSRLNIQTLPSVKGSIKLGTDESEELEKLMKTSPSFKRYTSPLSENSRPYWPVTLEELLRDPDFPAKHYLYFSDGVRFKIKAALENSPEQNNQEEPLKDFCGIGGGSIFKSRCLQENGTWYLIHENAKTKEARTPIP